MKKRQAMVTVSFVFAFASAGILIALAYPAASIPVSAQAVTPSPLSLTPISVLPPQPAAITAGNVGGLALFAVADIPQGWDSEAGMFWLPGGGAGVLIGGSTLQVQTVTAPDASPLELELLPQETSGHQNLARLVKALAFSPDGKVMIGGGEFYPQGNSTKFVQTWDLATGKMLDFAAVEGGTTLGIFFSLALSPDGRLLAEGGSHGLHLWQVTPDGKLLPGPQIEAYSANVYCVVFSPDSQQLVISTDTGLLNYSFSGQAPLPSLGGQSLRAEQLVFSPDGSLLAASASYLEDDALLWNVKTGEQTVFSVGPGSFGAYRLAFNPDGSLLAAATADEVRLWDINSLQVAASLKLEVPNPFPNEINALAFSPDGTRLMVGAFTTPRVWLWGIP